MKNHIFDIVLITIAAAVVIAELIYGFLKLKEKIQDSISQKTFTGIIALSFAVTIILAGAGIAIYTNLNPPEMQTPDNQITTSSDRKTNDTAISNNYESCEFLVNNSIKQSLPVSYADFSAATGYVFDDADSATTTVKPYQIRRLIRLSLQNNPDKYIFATIQNQTNADITYNSCTIVGIEIASDSDASSDIIFPMALQIKSKVRPDTIINIIGYPSSRDDSDPDDKYLIWTGKTADADENFETIAPTFELHYNKNDQIKQINMSCEYQKERRQIPLQ